MSDLAGTPLKLVLDGVSFDVMADANFSEAGSHWENTSVATSGRNVRKMTRRPEMRENVVVACNGAERTLLKEFAERTEDFSMSYTTAGGDVYSAVGWIEFATRETEENRATLQLHPRNGWEEFVAS